MEPRSTDEKVAANVRAEMGRKKCNQVVLADRIGMTQQALSRRLAGQTPFTVDELSRVAAALDVLVTTLIDDPAITEASA
jgi:transcriptional regulator with XRE-family HTH domain